MSKKEETTQKTAKQSENVYIVPKPLLDQVRVSIGQMKLSVFEHNQIQAELEKLIIEPKDE